MACFTLNTAALALQLSGFASSATVPNSGQEGGRGEFWLEDGTNREALKPLTSAKPGVT